MKMRWPAQHAMPQVLYLVSSLAQKVNHATISTFNEAIKVLNIMKEEVQRGHGRLWYRPIPEKDMTVVTYFNASLGKEDQGKLQLAAMHFVADKRVEQGPADACVADFAASKGIRVVLLDVPGCGQAPVCALTATHPYGRESAGDSSVEEPAQRSSSFDHGCQVLVRSHNHHWTTPNKSDRRSLTSHLQGFSGKQGGGNALGPNISSIC